MGAVTDNGWISFHWSDPRAVIDLVRTVAARSDPGEHGDGVEVVIETPPPSGFGRMVLRRGRAQARLVVTGAGGTVGYPFEVQLVSEHRGRAARKVGARPGWAVSNSAGLAFLIQKGRPGATHDFAALVTTAVRALRRLRPRAPDTGWRAAIDRRIARR
jgi:hypothetical protein